MLLTFSSPSIIWLSSICLKQWCSTFCPTSWLDNAPSICGLDLASGLSLVREADVVGSSLATECGWEQPRSSHRGKGVCPSLDLSTLGEGAWFGPNPAIQGMGIWQCERGGILNFHCSIATKFPNPGEPCGLNAGAPLVNLAHSLGLSTSGLKQELASCSNRSNLAHQAFLSGLPSSRTQQTERGILKHSTLLDL